MKRRRQDQPRQERHAGEPDVDRLVTEFRRAVDDRDTNYWERQRVNYETRYCLWANQSWDGRKWRRKDGKRPFPWLGASDARVPLVDKYIREDAALLMQVWANQKVLVRPTRPAQDAGWANRVTSLLRWQIYEEMEETETEAELLANMLLERGSAAVGIWWMREEQLTRETVTLEAITMAAQRAQQAIAQGQRSDALELQANLPQLILDPTREAEVAMILGSMGSHIQFDEAKAKKMVRELRQSGVASFARTIVAKDRPCIRAMAWNEDVILPPECVDIQRSRVVFVRELLTETDLTARAKGYAYDPQWVDQVIETQRGKLVLDPSEYAANRNVAFGRGDADTRNLFEIITAYERLYDEDEVPGIWNTVFCPGLNRATGGAATSAKHELLDYAHGQFPIVEFALERRSRLVDDSRGYGERAHTFQQGIKRQWDARSDRADVATLPPSHHPPDEEPDSWGPGVQIPTMQPERFGYFDAPKFDQGSNEVEETVRRFADEYFGRPVDDQNTVEAGALKQDLVRGWLRGWKRVFTQVMQLDQQYLPDEVWVMVVGHGQGKTMRVTREEIQGPFNVTLRFNSRDLDPEFVQTKVQLLQQAMQFDVNGRLDRDEALLAAIELIDPSYAERLVKPGEAAALEQIDDEQTVLTKLVLGIGVDVRGDEAFALRRSVLEQTIRQSPTLQQAIRMNPQAQELVQRRIQQLDFNIQQRMVNPEIGRRLGSKPMSVTGPGAKPPATPSTP